MSEGPMTGASMIKVWTTEVPMIGVWTIGACMPEGLMIEASTTGVWTIAE